MKKEKKFNYDILDITKIILAFMIVAIHSSLFPKQLYPWLRLAVPLFFIISSFLLFKKLNNYRECEKKEIVKKYVIRLLKLYLFWFIILLPYTIIIRKNWFDNGIFLGTISTIKNILFSSTFPASWYITATIEGTIIVTFFSKNKNTYLVLIILSMLSYTLCCLASSYTYIINDNLVIILEIIKPQFTFLISIIYILIGKEFAEGKFDKINSTLFLSFTIIFGILLFNEWLLTSSKTGIISNDCLFFILPLSISIFGTILKINIKIKHAKTLRQLSSFIYPLHIFVISVIHYIAKLFVTNDTIITVIVFLMTIIISSTCFFAIKKLQKYPLFNFLKYSY